MTKPNEIPWTPYAAAVYDPAYGELVQELNDHLIHGGVSLKTSIHIMATVTSHLPQINASVREKELRGSRSGRSYSANWTKPCSS